MNILMVSLGCDKNLCDSEAMLGLLAKHNYNITNDEQEADAIIVNTCSFIKDAMEESVNTVLEMAKLKQQNLKYLIVTGCMAQRFKDEIFDEIPEIDACLGTSSFDKILDVIEELKARDGIEDAEEISVYDDIDRLATITESNKVITSGTFMGYLKIAEGCDKFCTYCVIPHIRGHYRSVPMEQLLKEAEYMASQGIEELVLVAQETTCYGKDLYGEKRLHVILKRMGRRTDRASIETVIGKLREAAPDIAIRTSLIAGFPGETQEDHEALMAFLDEQELDRVGVFTYSREDGTPAATFENQIDEETAEQWRNEIMELQQEISLDKNETFVGMIMQVIIEGYSSDDDVYVGRTYRDAPGVDGLVFVNCDYELMSGQIVDVRINEVGPYDMIGGIVDESAE